MASDEGKRRGEYRPDKRQEPQRAARTQNVPVSRYMIIFFSHGRVYPAAR